MACEAPALKDLPKVAGDLKSELEGFKTTCLKNADTHEKIVLPTAEGMDLYSFNTEFCFEIYIVRHFCLNISVAKCNYSVTKLTL